MLAIAQVRAVLTVGDKVVTGSRDKTVKIWAPEGNAYALQQTMVCLGLLSQTLTSLLHCTACGPVLNSQTYVSESFAIGF